MKHTKLLVIALLVALFACLAVNAMADETTCPNGTNGMHLWNYTETKPAGCETQGLITIECTQCHYVKYQTIPATGHSFKNQNYQLTKPATCANQFDTYQMVCDNCGVHWSSDNVRKVAHPVDHVKQTRIAGKDVSCTADGRRELAVCANCGAIIVENGVALDGSVIKATGHDFTGKPFIAEKAVEATCKDPGKAYQECTKCGEIVNTLKTPVNPKYHDQKNLWVPIIPAKAPTCTETGCKALEQCPICGATKGGDVIKAAGHKFEDANWIYLPATCVKDGAKYCDCSVCGHRTAVIIPATGHSATWMYDGTFDGYQRWVLHCGLCGNDIASQLVAPGQKAPTGHVDTGKVKVDISVTGTGAKEKAVEVAKNNTTKKTTKTTTAKKTTTTATAVTATEVKPAAATELGANAVALAGNDVYTVTGANGKVYLDVEVADGKITVNTLKLGADESVVAFADAAAAAAPTADNTIVLVEGVATELPATFTDAIVAVVKTADLPVATASK